VSGRFGYVYRHGRRIKVETITPPAPAQGKRRKAAKLAETWAKIPHGRGLKLAKQAGNPVLAVLLILEAAIHDAHSNQVKLTNSLLRLYKIGRQSKTRGLRQLTAAGVISVEGRGREAPVITHHWYTKKGKLKS
jgi:hypothetical protein